MNGRTIDVVGALVGLGVGETYGVTVTETDGVGVLLGVLLTIGLAVGLRVAVGEGVALIGAPVLVGVFDGYGVLLGVAPGVGLTLAVREGVTVGVADAVGVGVIVTLLVTDGDGGGTGEISGLDPPHPQHLLLTLLKANGTISGSAAGLIIIICYAPREIPISKFHAEMSGLETLYVPGILNVTCCMFASKRMAEY